MALMTTYDDPVVNALVARIDAIPDESIARLCCIIEATLADGRVILQDQPMAVADFAYDRAPVSALCGASVPNSVYPPRLMTSSRASCPGCRTPI